MSLYIGIKRRRGTAAGFTSANPILLDGQWAYETDSFTLSGGIRYYKFKIGDGVTAWVDLPYSRLAAVGGGGSTSFIGLTDVPASFSGQGSKYVKVNETADGLEFEPIEAADLPAGIDVSKFADGTISNAEFQYLNNVSSNIQTQLNSKQATSEKGNANGYAELDSGGKVPTSQLPAYVDDVLEYANFAALPATGSTGIIYVTLDTNLTYRWSGSAYVEISASLALGETSSTAYRGDRGKAAYDYSTVGHLPLTGGNLSGAVNETTGPDVPSGSTVNLTSTNAGNYYTITGSTGPITAFGTIQAGTRRHLRFTGTPTITHHATSMILPTGASIVVAAGDTATFMSLGGGNWVCLHYSRATGAALLAGGAGITVASTTITSGTDTYVGYNNAGVYGESSLLQVITSISRVVASNVLLQNGEAYVYKANSRNSVSYLNLDGGDFGIGTDNAQITARFDQTGMITADAVASTKSTKAVGQFDSTTRGFLPPRMTTTQRDNITSVPEGLIIYNTTTHKINAYNGSAWKEIAEV